MYSLFSQAFCLYLFVYIRTSIRLAVSFSSRLSFKQETWCAKLGQWIRETKFPQTAFTWREQISPPCRQEARCLIHRVSVFDSVLVFDSVASSCCCIQSQSETNSILIKFKQVAEHLAFSEIQMHGGFWFVSPSAQTRRK